MRISVDCAAESLPGDLQATLPAPSARRNDDMIAAVKIMGSQVGDEPMNSFAFSSSESGFQELLATTWNELEGRGLIEERGEKRGPTFRLTPAGWLGGLRVLGGLDDPQTLARAVAIRKALKGRIKGRQAYDWATVDVRDLAQELNLPVGRATDSPTSGRTHPGAISFIPVRRA
jgi:hypothetical protein